MALFSRLAITPSTTSSFVPRGIRPHSRANGKLSPRKIPPVITAQTSWPSVRNRSRRRYQAAAEAHLYTVSKNPVDSTTCRKLTSKLPSRRKPRQCLSELPRISVLQAIRAQLVKVHRGSQQTTQAQEARPSTVVPAVSLEQLALHSAGVDDEIVCAGGRHVGLCIAHSRREVVCFPVQNHQCTEGGVRNTHRLCM